MMRKITKPSLLILFMMNSLTFQNCEDVPEFKPGDQLPVVEAFLYANEQVDNIIISEVIPFGSTDNEVSISGLSLTITHNSTTYSLTEKSGEPGTYSYDGEDLVIQSGGRYELSFNFDGRQVTSSTIVPRPPQGLVISNDEIFLPQLIERSDIIQLIQNINTSILVEWDNPNGDYYFVIVENIESNPEPIDLNNILDFNFQFISRPTQSDFFTIRPLTQITQFGKHRIIVYRVNEEYALLYETLEQDSRDLNEPFSNITNGVGIFSGFASDTIYLEVKRQ